MLATDINNMNPLNECITSGFEQTLSDLVQPSDVILLFALAHIQGTRPQTLAYALTDSPAGQLAWIVEKFKEWTDSAAELPEDAVNRDRLLTNVSLYWFTATAGSSTNLAQKCQPVWRCPPQQT
jgi:hypothetical protein